MLSITHASAAITNLHGPETDEVRWGGRDATAACKTEIDGSLDRIPQLADDSFFASHLECHNRTAKRRTWLEAQRYFMLLVKRARDVQNCVVLKRAHVSFW